MTGTTTVRVSHTTRDEIRALAEADDLTIDQVLHKLARAERQRRMGADLAANPLSEENLALVRGYGAAIEIHGTW